MPSNRRRVRERAQLDQLESELASHIKELAAIAFDAPWRPEYMDRTAFVKLLSEWAFFEFRLRSLD